MKPSKTLYIALGSITIGLFFGWLLFGGNLDKVEETNVASTKHSHEAGEVWTCTMHPQVRKDGPGDCPICGMDLIPVSMAGAETAGDGNIRMTSSALQIANVQTVTVQRAEPTKEIYLSGKVEADERNIAEITARFAGRIEKLYVNVTGQEVKRGQALASVYSPELITAQKELFEAAKFRETNPSFYEAAVNKLKLWDLSDRQIQDISKSKEVRYQFNILAPQSGTVVARNVSAGDYVEEGQSLFEVTSLSQVWVIFDAYERDLPWMQEGDEIQFTVQALPGQPFTSEITFIDPVINAQKRVAEVRTEVKNGQGQLKPRMFAQGIVRSALPGVKNALIIPKTAVLWTGKRAVVYVKQPDTQQPTFAYREVMLGPEAGGHYIVSEGLEEGEEVVANGVFKVDAAAQLQGKVSMMNPRPDGPGLDSPRPDDQQMRSVSEKNVGNGKEAADSPVAPKFAQQVAAVLKPYLALKNALVVSDAKQAAAAATQTQQALEGVDMEIVKGAAHQQWMNYLTTMNEALDIIENNTTLEAQREALVPLSKAFYQSVKQFNLTGLDAYYQYCPMADSDEGAFWLSESREINNPYFGEDMLDCGETREVLE